MIAPTAHSITESSAPSVSSGGNGRSVAARLRGVTVSYGGQPALQNVSLDVPVGEIVAVVGPNGAGKTTFLKALLGLVPLDSGSIEVFGRPIDEVRSGVAYVPQTETVDWDFPITAGEVVVMGRYPHMGLWRRPGRADVEAVQGALETVQMRSLARRHIRQLSGGQQQRIFIARALAQGADLFLFDEPFAGVDAQTEHALFELMGRLSREGKTLLIVNHDLSILDRFHSVLLLNRSVVACGPTAEVATPENLRRTYGGRLQFVERAEQALREGPSDVSARPRR